MNGVRRKEFSYLVALLAGMLAPPAHAFDARAYRLVDLTHPFNTNTIYWPTEPMRFKLTRLAYGDTPAGYFYSANAFCAPEHGGTHIDAPIHFGQGKRTLEAVPLKQLIAPAIVIDIARNTFSDRDYRLTRQDVLDFERAHGVIAAGSIVFVADGMEPFLARPQTLSRR